MKFASLACWQMYMWWTFHLIYVYIYIYMCVKLISSAVVHTHDLLCMYVCMCDCMSIIIPLNSVQNHHMYICQRGSDANIIYKNLWITAHKFLISKDNLCYHFQLTLRAVLVFRSWILDRSTVQLRKIYHLTLQCGSGNYHFKSTSCKNW